MKAETDLYCPRCGAKIYEKGDKIMQLFFTRSEERCSQCDAMLRRRTPGGQSDPWKFITEPLSPCVLCGSEKTYHCTECGVYSCYSCDHIWRLKHEVS